MPTYVLHPARRRTSGMGDWGSAAVALIADRELGQLTSAVHRMLDKLISLIQARRGIYDGYQQAYAAYQNAQKKFGPAMIPGPMGMSINVLLVPFSAAYASARKGVAVMAREVQTLGFMDRVFTQISAALTRAGLSSDANIVDQALAQIRRFTVETDDLFFPIPEYMDMKRAILAKADVVWGQMGVRSNAYDDQRWLAGYLKAAEQVVPIEGAPPAPSDVRAAGLGLPILANLLLWAIGIVTAGMVLANAIARVLPDQNSKAKTAEQLLLKYQEQKEREASQMRAAGRPESEISARMQALDQEAKRAVETIPDPPSLFKPIAISIGVVAVGYVAGKVFGIL